jgi:hypothetical protein
MYLVEDPIVHQPRVALQDLILLPTSQPWLVFLPVQIVFPALYARMFLCAAYLISSCHG